MKVPKRALYKTLAADATHKEQLSGIKSNILCCSAKLKMQTGAIQMLWRLQQHCDKSGFHS